MFNKAIKERDKIMKKTNRVYPQGYVRASSYSKTYTIDEVISAIQETAPAIADEFATYPSDYFSDENSITREEISNALKAIASDNSEIEDGWTKDWEDFVLCKLPR